MRWPGADPRVAQEGYALLAAAAVALVLAAVGAARRPRQRRGLLGIGEAVARHRHTVLGVAILAVVLAVGVARQH